VAPSLPAADVGRKTTVWATAKHWPGCCPADAVALLFMKLTELGDRHWHGVQRELGGRLPLVRWPQAYEDCCREFVGADPGTGIRLLWWLRKLARPAQVSVFGMDCWQTTTHWSGRGCTKNHVPRLEAEAMRKLLS